MKCCSYKSLITLGSVLIVLGIISIGIKDVILDFVLKQNLVLSPHSSNYQIWKNLSLPLTNKMYLFNITNAEDVAVKGAKPKITEVGPYIFKEYHTKIDEVWNDNGTVTYKQINKWIPVSDNLDELVTIVNPPAATLGAKVKPFASAFNKSLEWAWWFGSALELKNETLFVTKTAREILFDGYNDPILDDGEWINSHAVKIDGLMSKFGFFFARNNTWYGNGIINMYTGEHGLSQMGNVAAFNYSTRSTFYPGECGKYHGSPELTPPYLFDRPKQYIFHNDLGRTLELNLTDRQSYIKGTAGYEYKIDNLFFANSTFNPKNKCFEHDHPLPNGVFDASPTRYGAPVFISQPHFYQADPYYTNLIATGSLKPNHKLHETSVVFEPLSGIAMKVSARFQINFKLNRIKELFLFENLPETTYLPTVWFEEHIELPQELLTKLWFLGYFSTFIIIAGGLMIIAGMIFILCGLLKYRTRNYNPIPDNETVAEKSQLCYDVENIVEENDEN